MANVGSRLSTLPFKYTEGEDVRRPHLLAIEDVERWRQYLRAFPRALGRLA